MSRHNIESKEVVCSCIRSSRLSLAKPDGIQTTCKPNKCYMYLLRINRSDGSEYTISRSYEEFVELELFVRGFRVKNKKSPKLPAKVKTTGRLSEISDYCNLIFGSEDLTNIDAVRTFFQPDNWHCTKCHAEEINIMNTDRRTNLSTPSGSPAGKQSNKTRISSPLQLPSYRVISTFESKDKRQISLKQNETVQLYQKCNSGWWMVVCGRKSGWFPASHLVSTSDDPVEEAEERRLPILETYKTVSNYDAKHPDEISFLANETLTVQQKRMDGWWIVRKDDREGFAPCVYLRPCDATESDSSRDCLCNQTLDMESPSRRAETSRSNHSGASTRL